MPDFQEFTEKFGRFQKQVILLVTSSFIFSGLSAVVQYGSFNVAFQTLTMLVVGVAGVAGILSQYLADLRNARTEWNELLRYDPPRSGGGAALKLLFAALLLWGFYELVVRHESVCIVPASLATFLFFHGLAGAFIGIATVERQRQAWNTLSPDERRAWAEQEIRRIRQEGKEAIKELRRQQKFEKGIEKISEAVEKIRRIADESKVRQRELAWKHRVEALRRFWIGIRKMICRGGDCLLTKSERADQELENLRIRQTIDELDMKLRQDNLEAIEKGEIPAVRSEQFDLTLYRVGREIYFDVPDQVVTQEVARAYWGA